MGDTKKTDKEKLEKLEAQMEKLKKQKQKIKSRQNAEERKARTKRLIAIGAEVEAFCGKVEDIEAFKKYLEKYHFAITRYLSDNSTVDTSTSSYVAPSAPEDYTSKDYVFEDTTEHKSAWDKERLKDYQNFNTN